MIKVLQYLLPKKQHLWLLICAASLGLSLFIQWNGRIQAIGGDHDSLKYLQMAESLLNGKWLGEYNQMTLIRLPVYPMFVALNSKMGWPLQRSQVLLYLASIGFLLAALRCADVARWRIATACLLCAFHPAGIFPSMYLAAEAIYTAVATMVLAGCIGVMGTIKKDGPCVYFWVFLLSAALALFWDIRSESVWIVPPAMAYVAYILWEMRHGYRKKPVILCLAILLPFLCVAALTVLIQQENKKTYGIAVSHELNEPAFVSAFQWLTRLDGGHHHPYIPVPRIALNQAYAVSPHFAMLKPFLSLQTDGRGWAKYGCEWMGICDELAGGWILWAVRDAAASVGVYQSAATASRFFSEVAREIETACKAGRVSCSRNPTGNMLAPPLMWQDLPRIFRSFVKMTVLTVTFGKLSEAIQGAPDLQPPAELASRYGRITHDQFVLHKNISSLFIRAVIYLSKAFQTAGGIWILIAFGISIRRWMKNPEKALTGSLPTQGWVTVCLMVFILSRLAIVAYIDAMSFYAQLRYLLVVYPALITLICLWLPFFGADSKQS